MGTSMWRVNGDFVVVGKTSATESSVGLVDVWVTEMAALLSAVGTWHYIMMSGGFDRTVLFHSCEKAN